MSLANDLEIEDLKSKILEQEKVVNDLKKEVANNHDLIQQIKGAGMFLKLCFVLAPTLGAFWVFVKNHIHYS